MNPFINIITQWAWSIAVAFLIVARDPATFVFRVRVDVPRTSGSTVFAVSYGRDVVLNGEGDEAKRAYLDEALRACRAYWGFVHLGAVTVHSPSQSCDTDTRYLVRLRPDAWR